MITGMTQPPSIDPPSIDTATDPIHSPDDMRERWRALMGPLGFGERLLWLGFVGPDRRMLKALTQIPIGRAPHRDVVEDLVIAVSVFLEDLDPGHSVALLLTRPGRDAITTDDRRWAEALTTAGDRIGVPLETVFRANDNDLVALS